MVYLLHFSRAFKHALHFVGATSRPAEVRALARGDVPLSLQSPLVDAARLDGISFRVVRTWIGDGSTARRLRARKGTRRLCYLCADKRYGDLT